MKQMYARRSGFDQTSNRIGQLFCAIIILLLLAPAIGVAQFIQQGNKLTGLDVNRPSQQGISTALSADGNTALVGGYFDGFDGAAWVFTRTNGKWNQQGKKLVGAGAQGMASQGYSVALSADGNTALIGGPDDNDVTGAAWVFVRQNGMWTQQGPKLVGTGAVGPAAQGVSVALSADGNTALIGGSADNDYDGAAWVFVRQNGVWAQQGYKLVGTGGYNAIQGYAVSLSADGNTALIGGPNDWFYTGAAWIFTRSNGVWSQQGPKLTPFDAVDDVGLQFGRAVSLSGDGQTALIGGPWDNYWTGAAWVFARDNDEWIQEGGKLVGAGTSGEPFQGFSVALSGDGNNAIIGGYYDDNDHGAAWMFERNDGLWSQQGAKLVGTGAEGLALQGNAVALSADGRTALVGGPNDNNLTGATWAYTWDGAAWRQQGEKLVGTGGAGYAYIGYSVALSADGNTAIAGGCNENFTEGAAWMYTRERGEWRQQGPKLVGAGAVQSPQGYLAAQGYYVALSGDGNTALVAGPYDNDFTGAAWVFTREKGIWTQQSEKLIGAGAIGNAFQGRSVALSADGNTAVICGPRDNGNTGAVWVYVRNNGIWLQQGPKLVPSGASGAPYLGRSAALSADGNTLIVGATFDNMSTGAAWVFTRQNGVWTQEGYKLVGADATYNSVFGVSVGLTPDGNTAIIGGIGDEGNTGAAWIFSRRDGIWSQQGEKLVGAGAVGQALQGAAVGLSADGKTAIISGSSDNTGVGAVWVFTRTGDKWTQQGNKLLGTGAAGNAGQGYSAALSADGTTIVVGGPWDNAHEGAAWVFATQACDAKETACLDYELLNISQDSRGRKTYEIKVTNYCSEPLSYLALQVPPGQVAYAPDNNAMYSAPAGRAYLVRSPSYTPFNSVRFSTVSEGIQNGAADIFAYTLPPQADPAYIRIMAKLGTQGSEEAYLNMFNCTVEKAFEIADRPADDRSTPPPAARLYPNPSTGMLFVDLSGREGQQVQFQVVNMQGQVVQTQYASMETALQQIELHAQLVNGMYMLKVMPEQGNVMSMYFRLER